MELLPSRLKGSDAKTFVFQLLLTSSLAVTQASFASRLVYVSVCECVCVCV